MVAVTIPIKTPDGHAELSTRQRRVSQRHRTVLFLVDGKRDATEVKSLALRAGVPESCFDELVALGLMMLPEPTFSLVLDDAPTPPDAIRVDLPLSGPDSVAPAPDSLLPASRTLGPESVAGDSVLELPRAPEPWPVSRSADTEPGDLAFTEARAVLMQAVRSEAPVAGSLTLLRLRRARTRRELAALLEEVEARIVKPHRSLAASQTLRRVRHLLGDHADSALLPA